MKQLSLLAVLLVVALGAKAQRCVQFHEADHSRQMLLSRTVSIDRVDGDLYTVYANEAELEALRALGYSYAEVVTPQPKAILMASTFEEMAAWDCYPTYDLYVAMMQRFESQYPTLCRLDTIGTSVRGRLILSVKISDNVALDEAEPQFFYSSTMHGDEVTGYYFMLRLIDTLLSSYGTSEQITQLVNNVQIYINPLANPDGTYCRGNNTVQGSMRYNANYVDLNRNFPDPFGSDPLNAIQPENVAMMSYILSHRFALSANLHGGSEVMNYPWDSFTSYERHHPDYQWWEEVSKRYVDSCRRVSAHCYNDVATTGYINGGDWYVIPNGRQDWVNYYGHCREITIEVSSTKTLSTTNLNSYWNTQGGSLINYIGEVLCGVQGVVIDSLTGSPVRAMVEVVDHDRDSSQVFSSALWGDFYRMLPTGVYTLRISAEGYLTKEVTVSVNSTAPTPLVVQLWNGSVGINKALSSPYMAYPNPTHGYVNLTSPQGSTSIDLRSYPAGVHIISWQGHSYKVVKY